LVLSQARRSDAAPPAVESIIDLSDVIRVYREAEVETIALRGIDLAIAPGEFVAVVGRSGSGKSTLLQLLAGVDRPTAGRVVVDGVDLSRADEDRRASLRGRRVGIVFQAENLASFLTLRENIELASVLAGRSVDRSAVLAILDRVGLADRAEHRPQRLSGGEQQRASLAAVLVTRPAIVLADEITGELDSASAGELLDLLQEIHVADAMTLVVATHDPEVARRANRIVELRDGRLVGNGMSV
jgi:ABC-type lipoprotein export system ATPase subunit